MTEREPMYHAHHQCSYDCVAVAKKRRCVLHSGIEPSIGVRKIAARNGVKLMITERKANNDDAG